MFVHEAVVKAVVAPIFILFYKPSPVADMDFLILETFQTLPLKASNINQHTIQNLPKNLSKTRQTSANNLPHTSPKPSKTQVCLKGEL